MRAWPMAWVDDPARANVPRVRRDRPLLNVVLTRGGISLDAPRFWHDPRTMPLVLSTSAIHVPRGECVTRPSWTPRAVIEELRSRDVQTVLLEGGGGVLGPFLQADLVDSLHVTLCPLVLGGGPTLVSGVAPWTREGAPRLRLTSALPVGDEVFLTYVRADGYGPLPGEPGTGDPR
jgi:riboflavin biosynthesis pyrimidine reductase